MIKVEYCTDKTKCVLKARQALVDKLGKLKESKTPTLLCLSGGSALEILKDFDFGVLGPHVTISVLDERYSTDPSINNMAQIYATGFIESAMNEGCELIDTRVKVGETIEELVADYNTAIVRWIENHNSGKIVATAGMGPDGHTSGIIPGSDNFGELFANFNEKYVVGYKAANQPEDRCERVTTNFEFLRRISFVVILVTGIEKHDGLSRVLAKEGDLSETPARVWQETVGQVFLFTDIEV